MIGLQTRALLVDAYRDLNARKMFWWVVVFTLLTLGIFATVGVSGNQLTLLGWEIPAPPMYISALAAYKTEFSNLVITLYMGFGATILALISTSSLFPDFIAGGSVDLYLSKPIGRARLFLTKYVTGLMFVGLQVTLVAAGSFFIMGWRAGYWAPSIFLAIPIVLTFFSYLYSICVFLGVLTRSAMAALFLTLLAWLMITGLNYLEVFGTASVTMTQTRAQYADIAVKSLDGRISLAQERLAAQRSAATMPGAASRPAFDGLAAEADIARLRRERDGDAALAAQREPPKFVQTLREVVFWVNTVVPKTRETLHLLNRVIITDEEAQLATRPVADDARGGRQGMRLEEQSAMEAFLRGRSVWWIVGSSLGFEAVMVGLGCWIFCRRDY